MYTKKMMCNAFFAAALQDNLRSYRVNSSRMTPYLYHEGVNIFITIKGRVSQSRMKFKPFVCHFDNVKSAPKELRTDDPCNRVGDE